MGYEGKIKLPTKSISYTEMSLGRKKRVFRHPNLNVYNASYILTEGDHRKVSMSEYVEGMQHTLSCITGRPIVALDFSDDRLAHLLKHLSKREYWSKIEDDLNKQSIEVYDLKPETIRCDATTVSADQAITEDGLVQFGHSKDNTKLPQIKLMSAALDPLGMPLASDVVSGEKADDGLYIPISTFAGVNFHPR